MIGSPRVDAQQAVTTTPQSTTSCILATPRGTGLEACAKCGLKLSGTVSNALNRKWHKACFKCRHCEKVIKLPGEFLSKDGKPYCIECRDFLSEECTYCKKKIQRAFVKVGEMMKLHPECYATLNSQIGLSQRTTIV